MSKEIVYKRTNKIEVYRNLDELDILRKKYLINQGIFSESREDLNRKYKKLIAIIKNPNWPDFVIKPKISLLYIKIIL